MISPSKLTSHKSPDDCRRFYANRAHTNKNIMTIEEDFWYVARHKDVVEESDLRLLWLSRSEAMVNRAVGENSECLPDVNSLFYSLGSEGWRFGDERGCVLRLMILRLDPGFHLINVCCTDWRLSWPGCCLVRLVVFHGKPKRYKSRQHCVDFLMFQNFYCW